MEILELQNATTISLRSDGSVDISTNRTYVC